MSSFGHRRVIRLRSFAVALAFSLVSALAGPAASYADKPSALETSNEATGQNSDAAGPAKSLSPEESSAAEKAAASGAPVEVSSLTKEDALTRAMPDGTFQTEVSTEPVRIKDAQGWHDLDSTLVAADVNGQRRFVPRRARADISLGRGGSDVVSYLGDRKGTAVTQKWPFGALPEPSVSGNAATYPEVIPGVDLVQLVHPSGVSQVLKVKTKEALADPRVAQMRFLLRVDGATVKDKGEGKGLAAETAEGKVALHTAEGQWWDSSQEGSTAKGPGGRGLTYPLALSLASEGGQQLQTLGMGTVTSAKNLVFPIFVDPDWTAGFVGSTYVDDGWPSVSYWGGNGLTNRNHVGFLGPPDAESVHHTQSYYQFNTSSLSGKPIFKAVMNVSEEHAYSCSPRAVSAWVTGGINSGTTWNSRPGNLQKVSTLNIAKGYTGCAAGMVGFDMGTAKGWLTNSPQWTVGLFADNPDDAYAWKQFNRSASLIVTYGVPPNTPTIYTIEGGLWTGTPGASTYVTRYSAPYYKVRSGDNDGSLGGNITVTMKVTRASDGYQMTTGTSAPGSPVSGTMFTWSGGSALPDGKYVLSAYAKDAQGGISGTMTFTFTVDTTPPDAPIITPSTGITPVEAGKGTTNAVPGQDTVTLNLSYSGKYGVDRFIYAVTKNGETAAPPASLACGTGSGPYRAICAVSNAQTIQVSPIDDLTTVNVWSVDNAGNVNLMKASTGYAKYVLDNQKATPVAATPELIPVTPSGGAAWVDQDVCVLPVTPAVDPKDCGYSDKRKVLDLTASTAKGDTTVGAVDSSKAYTMAAWVKPQGTSGPQSIMTQMANSGGPGARLGILLNGTSPQLSLTGWSAATTTSSVLANGGVTAGVWKYVVAVNDPANKQLRITLTDADSVTTWVTATAPTAFLAADTTRPVQFGYQAAAPTEVFRGQVYHPVLTAGALTTKQIGDLSTRFETARNNNPSLSDEGLMVK